MKKRFNIFVFLLIAFNGISQTWNWATSVGGIGGEGNAICNDPNGNLILVGGIGIGTTSIGSNTFTTTQTPNVCVIKYDPSGNVLWARIHSTGAAYGVSSDNNGNILVTGNFTNSIVFGTYTLNSVGDEDIFIMKYDSNGNVLWAKSAGGNGYEGPLSLTTDPSGNSVITGFHQSPTLVFGTYVLNATGGLNMFVAKYDPNGNVLWASTPSTYGSCKGRSVSTDAFGNIFATGTFDWSTITFGSVTINNSGNNNDDFFLVKYDPSGNALWVRSGYGLGDEEGYALSTDQLGNTYLTGFYSSATFSIGTTNFNNTGTNMFIAKFDPSGNNLWAKTSVGVFCAGYGIRAYAGGAFVVGGFSASNMIIGTNTLTPINTNSTDMMFIARYDPTGNINFAQSLAGGGDDVVGVSVDPFCNAYIGGDLATSTVVIGSTTLVPNGAFERLFAAKLNLGISALYVNGISGICTGQSATLVASGATSYSWAGGPATNSYVVSPSTTTTYSVSGSAGVCQYTATPTLSVNALPILTVSAVNTVICAGNTATLTAVGANSFSWSVQSSVISISPSITVSPIVTGTYTYVIAGTNTITGCANSTTTSLNITVNALPVLTVSTVNSVVCINKTATLKATGANLFNWRLQSAIVGTNSALSLSLGVVGVYIYSVTGTNSLTGCSNSSTISITISKCTGIYSESNENNAIRLYPNPNNGSFEIDITDESANNEIFIYGMTGQLIHKETLRRGINVISNMINMPKGIYQYRILLKNGAADGKIIIQ